MEQLPLYTSFALLFKNGWPLLLLLLLFLMEREARHLQGDERRYALLMALLFLLVITGYWILKPLKKSLFLGYYHSHPFSLFGRLLQPAQVELLAKEINVLVAFSAAFGVSLLARYLRRERLLITVTLIMAAGLGFSALLINTAQAAGVWFLYLGGDLYITVLVASFFAFLNDSESPWAAKNIYGLVGVGGTLGGLVGSSLMSGVLRDMGAGFQLGSSFVLTLLMLPVAYGAGRIVQRHPPHIMTPPEAALDRGAHGWTAKLAALFGSRYLMAIAIMVVLYEMISTMVDYQFSSMMQRSIVSHQLSGAFSDVYLVTNLFAVTVQLVVTRPLLTHWGPGVALLVLPAALFVGSFGFLLYPVVLIGAMLSTIDNGLAYSLQQSAKELLYVPISVRDKYKAKCVIDIFVMRAAKGGAIVVGLILSLAFSRWHDLRWLSLVVMGLIGVWLLVISLLIPAYRRREAQAGGD